jgi:hypothetical protein
MSERYVVACAEGCITACDFETREEAERALEAIARQWPRHELFIRPSTRRDRRQFGDPAGFVVLLKAH